VTTSPEIVVQLRSTATGSAEKAVIARAGEMNRLSLAEEGN
jgi:hypothetical protein